MQRPRIIKQADATVASLQCRVRASKTIVRIFCQKNRPLSVRALENLSGLCTLDILGQCAENVISKLQFSVFQAHFSLFASNVF